MFVFRVKLTKNRVVLGICVLLALAVLLVHFTCGGRLSLPSGKDYIDRTTYLRTLGYKVCASSEVEVEVKIPDDFEDVYKSYNKKQLKAGFDLDGYRNTIARLFTYKVEEFGGYSEVYANLLVENGRIIGGDISSIEDGGFIFPLLPRRSQPQKSADQNSELQKAQSGVVQSEKELSKKAQSGKESSGKEQSEKAQPQKVQAQKSGR